MSNQNYLSLWIGNINSIDELKKYIENPYIENEDDEYFMPSQFLKDFDIKLYDIDEDFIETAFFNVNLHSIRELLLGCSYDDVIIPQYENLIQKSDCINSNCTILVYNFNYNQAIKKVENTKYQFQFIGSVKYV